MRDLEKIAGVENEIEALCLKGELQERGIPHMLQSYYDSAYDGLYQFSGGWGHVEAAAEHRNEILAILEEIRQRPSHQADETREEADSEGAD